MHPLKVERIDWPEAARVIRQTYNTWSVGLDRAGFEDYLWWMRRQGWVRRRTRFYAGRLNEEVVTSCRLYPLDFTAGTASFRVGGIGAVFTSPHRRGLGYATSLLESLIKSCRQEGFDALLLYSDIGEELYGSLGFMPLGALDFYLFLDDRDNPPGSSSDVPAPAIVKQDQVPMMVQHHRRWLARQPFGLTRSCQFWSYKLAREQYLQGHARARRPELECLSVTPDRAGGGYALVEHGDRILRVLEVAGSAGACENLWQEIIAVAIHRGVRLIRGWEGAAPCSIKGLKYIERDWARPMLLPIAPATQNWLKATPCPLLELDHF